MSEARVAKRKTHTKSRKGCFQCKQRHTKCNEARPRCANCVRLDISCTWPEVNSGHSASPQTSPAAYVSPNEEKTGQVASNNFDLSIPDMRLLHHWTSKGYVALHPNLAKRSDVWQCAMVELGFEHPFLLHGILALSAIHKASFYMPGDRQELLSQADAHISRALDVMRTYLQTPSEETAIPMFVLSSVLLTYNFASVQERPDDPIGSVHHCFMLLNGIKVVIGTHWDRLKDNPSLAHFVAMSAPATLSILDKLAGDEQRPEILHLLELTELVLDAQDKQACTEAIKELHYVAVRCRHINTDRDDEHPFLWLWAARTSNHFFGLLAAHNPIACIIVVHFGALLAQARQVWWVAKWPRWLLTATEQLLAATPDLLTWLDWPRHVINPLLMTAAATPHSS
ncbi:hypothetical protein HBI88_033690 [Parastagonospora nodorum]|nr:hypothetical protein HBI71_078730 [Parastagonospora nodorum]KAH5735633.1 hypothetical protein HBI17_195940 [Parastagonospora nodorum]KAH5765415.1 hypothetical protein HBI97_175870 [Parastagonospora nodorum]KAH5821077.1 hypothetical protein HBI96_039670 [Parastagonospora nodorum]KAH5831411.1 hypothetical protein HBI94_031630 [Parastagonospora nodorum]